MYTTYQICRIINETRSIEELRKWAGMHDVYKSNAYEWSKNDLDELLKEYTFRDRLIFKTSHKIALNEGEKKNLVFCSCGKNANTYNIDINYYLSFIPPEDQINIKRNNNISLKTEDYLLMDKNHIKLLDTEKEIIVKNTCNGNTKTQELEIFQRLISEYEFITIKKKLGYELTRPEIWYYENKTKELELKKQKEIEEAEQKHIAEERRKKELERQKRTEETMHSLGTGCLYFFIIVIGAFCLFVRCLL